MNVVEKQIRGILSKAINTLAKDNNVDAKAVKIGFYPFDKGGNDIDCRYCLFVNNAFKEEITYQDISGIWFMALQPIVEGYIKQLFLLINSNENIELNDIRIVIKPTSENPKHEDLKAFLFEGSHKKRVLDVAEFVSEN